jgi:hypothetical protein
MTAQAGDHIHYQGEELTMATEPLEQYLCRLENRPVFRVFSTACWRGYQASWTVREGKLWLTGLTGYIKDYEMVGMDFLFPDRSEVFAEWFTGTIRIPHGKLLMYVHMEYSSVYENEIFLEFEKGNLIHSHIQDKKNSPLDKDISIQ